MMKFKLTHEDGDYQVFHSTNHDDPDRIGTIVVDHALPGSAIISGRSLRIKNVRSFHTMTSGSSIAGTRLSATWRQSAR